MREPHLLAGEVQISKSERDFMLPIMAFVGELANLRDTPATASVTVQSGGVVVSWPHATLRRAVSKDEDLKHTLSTLLNQDLAEKVARA